MRFSVLLTAVALLSLAGCAPRKKAGTATYLLPWTDAQGGYSLQEVPLTTLDSPFEAKGSAAEIYYQPAFSDSGFSGHTAEPHVVKAGHVYVPQDVASSLALAVYAQIEHLYDFERRLGFDKQLSWPRRIGVELNLIGGIGNQELHNNAEYFSKLDVIGLLPYSMSANGVPFSLNQGIVAHEHFHAHFQSQVLNPLNAGTGLDVSALENLFYSAFNHAIGLPDGASSEGGRSSKLLNDIVMRAWNEGLADLFAVLYTKRPEFFIDSAPQFAQIRGLDQPLQPIANANQVMFAAAQVFYNRDVLVSWAYTQGTALARLLYQFSQSGAESPEAFLQRVMSRLPAIGQAVESGYTTQVMDMDMVLPILLEGFPVTPSLCKDLRLIVTSATLSNGFPTCVSF